MADARPSGPPTVPPAPFWAQEGPQRLAERIQSLLQLTVASAAVGNAVSIELGPSGAPISPGLNLLLGAEAPELLLPLLQRAVAPLLQFQAELIQRCQVASPRVREEYAQALEVLKQLESAVFPDPRHIAHARQRMLELKQQLCPRLVAQDIDPGQLASALQGSPDEALLHLITDQGRLDQLMNRLKRAQTDLQVMRSAWLQQPWFPPFPPLPSPGRGDVGVKPLQAPCLNTVIVSDHARMRRFMRLATSERGASLRSIWPITIPAAVGGLLAGMAGMAIDSEWHAKLQGLALMRSHPGQVYRLSQGAAEMLQHGLDNCAHLCTSQWDKDNLERSLLRLLLGLHLLQSPGDPMVPPERMETAIDHFKWLLGTKQKVVQEAANHKLEVTPATKERMLQKIAAKQPVSWHDLRRSYKCDVRPYMRAVLHALEKEGLVARDERDRIILRRKPGTRGVPEVPFEIEGKRYFGIVA